MTGLGEESTDGGGTGEEGASDLEGGGAGGTGSGGGSGSGGRTAERKR